jgi:hypothetical protein
MSKHSPGPWAIETKGPALRYVIKDECNEALAQTYGQPEQEADAALMAAAPDLLNALKVIATLYPEQCGQPADEVYGINDGKQRGILLQAALDIARKAIKDLA